MGGGSGRLFSRLEVRDWLMEFNSDVWYVAFWEIEPWLGPGECCRTKGSGNTSTKIYNVGPEEGSQPIIIKVR